MQLQIKQVQATLYQQHQIAVRAHWGNIQGVRTIVAHNALQGYLLSGDAGGRKKTPI